MLLDLLGIPSTCLVNLSLTTTHSTLLFAAYAANANVPWEIRLLPLVRVTLLWPRPTLLLFFAVSV